MNSTLLRQTSFDQRSAAVIETEVSFARALQRFAEPLRTLSDSAIRYVNAVGREVVLIGGECRCGRNGSASLKTSRRKHYKENVEHAGHELGRVEICCPANSPDGQKSLASLVTLARQELVRAEDEFALLAELSASWESLQAVYDLNADFSSSQDPKSLLVKITERTTAINPRVKAALWLEDGVQLVAAATNTASDLKPRSRTSGAIGDAFLKRRSAIFNDHSEIHIDIESEPELRSAKRMTILPLTTRVSTYGVLVVWLESDEATFDSRMMRLLDTLALQAAMVVENDHLNRDSIQNEKLKQEIDIGSKIQQTLLSGTAPVGLDAIKIAAASISSQKIDGDFYEFIEHGNDCFDVIIGDVMGKGIPAALVGAATKNSFLRAIGRLQAADESFRPSPERIVSWVNLDVTPKLISLDSFVTACYTRFDLGKKEMTFVDCGHTKTIHYRFRDGQISFLEGENLPLGFSNAEIFVQKTIPIEEGDLLFFYSDGVTETKNPLGELFGESRLLEFIRLIADLEPETIISTLIDNLFRFSSEEKFNDDLTCVVIRYGEVKSTCWRESISESFDSRLDELGQVREFTRRVAAFVPVVPLDETRVSELELAVAEAFTNIVRHACGGASGTPISFSATRSANGIELVFSYEGTGFDPRKVPPPVFDGSADGGFGLFIIENCVDFVGYLTDKNNRHSIHLVKNSPGKEEN